MKAQTLKAAGVPYIVDMWYAESFLGEQCKPRLLMEYCDRGTISQYVAQENSVFKRMEIGLQLAVALDALHKKGFLHLDLKNGNVLVRTCGERVEIRLVDFGMSCCTKKRKPCTRRKATYPALSSAAVVHPFAFGDQERYDTDNRFIVLSNMWRIFDALPGQRKKAANMFPLRHPNLTTVIKKRLATLLIMALVCITKEVQGRNMLQGIL